jgi:hypothetical protein
MYSGTTVNSAMPPSAISPWKPILRQDVVQACPARRALPEAVDRFDRDPVAHGDRTGTIAHFNHGAAELVSHDQGIDEPVSGCGSVGQKMRPA